MFTFSSPKKSLLLLPFGILLIIVGLISHNSFRHAVALGVLGTICLGLLSLLIPVVLRQRKVAFFVASVTFAVTFVESYWQALSERGMVVIGIPVAAFISHWISAFLRGIRQGYRGTSE
jgi:hypothetical protein